LFVLLCESGDSEREVKSATDCGLAKFGRLLLNDNSSKWGYYGIIKTHLVLTFDLTGTSMESRFRLEESRRDHAMVLKLMHDCFLEVIKNKYVPLDPDLDAQCRIIFFSATWGYREILLLTVVARLLDPNYQATKDFYACHPRSLFERSIRPVLSDFSIPCRMSGVLNMAKAARKIDESWALGRRSTDRVVAQTFVGLVSLVDHMAYRELQNFAINLHALFLQERDTVIRLASDIDASSQAEQNQNSAEVLQESAAPIISVPDVDISSQPEQGLAEIPQEKGNILISRLKNLPVGSSAALDYEHLVNEILSYLFEPEDLIDGKMQVRTYDNTHIMDILFLNESDKIFWSYVRDCNGLFVLFELKNVHEIATEHINQVATYMGRYTGSIAFLVTRNKSSEAMMRKLRAVYNNSTDNKPKTILVLTDADLEAMIHLQQEKQLTVRYLAKIFRDFVTTMQ
jgi:hypothetical protein